MLEHATVREHGDDAAVPLKEPVALEKLPLPPITLLIIKAVLRCHTAGIHATLMVSNYSLTKIARCQANRNSYGLRVRNVKPV